MTPEELAEYNGMTVHRNGYDYELQQRPPGKAGWEHVRWYSVKQQALGELERVRENYPNGEFGEWRLNRRLVITMHGPTEFLTD